MGYPDERVDSHDGHLRLGLGVVDEEEIDELLEIQGGSLHASQDIREQGAHVVSHGDVRHDLLHRHRLPLPVRDVQFIFQLRDVTYGGGRDGGGSGGGG